MQTVDNELHEYFETNIRDPDVDMLDVLWPYVNPHMSEHERARKAALIVLASPLDKHGFRGRCHMLMTGPGGTGKSLIRNWVVKTFSNAYASGPSDSEAGLKANLGNGTMTPGALQLAHEGYLGIDELDKYASEERGALLEAMSDGEFAINKGETKQTFDAETRVIAACNRTEKFRAELIDRFDFVIEVEQYDMDETIVVSDDRYDHFRAAYVTGDVEDEKYVIPQYLGYIGDYTPGVSEGVLETIKSYKNTLIQENGLSGGIRKKEAWIRAAFTIARLNRRDMQFEDYVQAIALVSPGIDQSFAFEDPMENGS